jgi:hypothetical protein
VVAEDVGERGSSIVVSAEKTGDILERRALGMDVRPLMIFLV